jgi:hypothetical protein
MLFAYLMKNVNNENTYVYVRDFGSSYLFNEWFTNVHNNYLHLRNDYSRYTIIPLSCVKRILKERQLYTGMCIKLPTNLHIKL